jgi:hypothetical protein
MSSRLLAATIFAAAFFATIEATAAPLSQPPASIPQAPIGHLQPRAPHFTPRSGAEQVEQDQMSTFDAEQHKLDVELDRSLNICHC